jgi:hypothetical protein
LRLSTVRPVSSSVSRSRDRRFEMPDPSMLDAVASAVFA